jgi:transposase
MVKKRSKSIYLEIQGHRKKPYGILRSSYREGGKVKHETHGRLTGLSLEKLKLIRAALQEEVQPKGDNSSLRLLGSKEYGASAASIALAKSLGLNKLIYSKPELQWVKDSLAMIAGRLIYQGSKLSLSNLWNTSSLWELSGVEGNVDVDEHCYEVMDRLYGRKDAIEKGLATKHLQNGKLVLYDITSSYMEGEYKNSAIVEFGYNRDDKRGHEQIVVALICNETGCPVGVEVFPGNTKDSETVIPEIKKIKEKYAITEIIFVGDRGMTTHNKLQEIRAEGFFVISALNHQQIQKLVSKEIVQLGLFDDMRISEVVDPEVPELRYCLCKNPETAKRETKTRETLLNKTIEELTKVQASKRKNTDDKISARVGKILAKYKVGKLIEWSVNNKNLVFSIKNEILQKEKQLDGCYVIVTDTPSGTMNTLEVVQSYKNLTFVEVAFRNLKTVQLEIRPVYHKLDHRIKSHVFICMLAYYLQWHMKQRLKPLFQQDGVGKYRMWTFYNVIETLKAIRSESVSLNDIKFNQTSELSEDQQYIVDLLDIRL